MERLAVTPGVGSNTRCTAQEDAKTFLKNSWNGSPQRAYLSVRDDVSTAVRLASY